MKRRDMLVALAVSGAGTALASCAGPQGPGEGLGEEQLRLMLRQLAGFELSPDEAPRVLAALKTNRFTGRVDPTTQPQSDFDAEVEA